MAGYIFLLFVAWRILLFVLAWTGSVLLPFSPRFPYSDVLLVPSRMPSWIWSFGNFDGVHYLTIAASGYSAQFTQVFFPVYPVIISLLQKVLPLQPLIAGIVLSNLFFLGSLFVFLKLLGLDMKEDRIRWTLLFLIFFPTSLYFGSLYTESLFFLLILLSFFYSRKGNFWLSGIYAALASATRVTGILLLPALLWEWNKSQIGYKKVKFKMNPREILNFTFYILRSPYIFIVPLGLITYMFYLQMRFGDWLYFWHAQPVFGAQRSGSNIILLPQVLFRYFKILITFRFGFESYWIAFLELSSVVFALVCLVVAGKEKIRTSYLIFGWLTFLMPTLTGTFSSQPRYILTIFPLFMALGLIKRRQMKVILLAIFFILFSILTILFTRGHWVA